MWTFIGLLVGVGLYWFFTSSGYKFTWWEYVLAALGLVLVLYSIQNYTASRVALEPRAANTYLMIFGLPGLILGAIPFVLAKVKSGKESG